MPTKKFHLGDILSITRDNLVSPRHIGGVYDILNFMTGDNLHTHQLTRASDECKPYLIEQFPQLTGPDMDLAIAELDNEVMSSREKVHMKKFVADWLAKQVAKYGEMFDVESIPTKAHEVKDPLMELAEIREEKA